MPTPKLTHCPSADTLHQFLDEALDESNEHQVQEHIDSCSDCQQKLMDSAGSQAVWSDVQEHLRDLPEPLPSDTPVPSDLDELMELLDPTDDPSKLGRLGSYEVCGLVGRGTTGLVMKALEPRLNRFVAIKLMSPSYTAIGSARWRFEREGRAVAAVSHEHVVPIYAVDDHRGLPYIVMKYIPGQSLQQRIERDGPLDTCGAARVGLQVAQGLSAAHAQGIIHRDVKPANVILEETVERAMVTDFGLARVADETSMTRSGTISGTPQFMSPEQARGEALDQRSDLFSLGSLLYTACTGRAPFRAENVFGVINRVCQSEPRPIHELHPEIAPWLVSFIEKLMAKAPAQRFASADEVATELIAELAYLQNPTAAACPPRSWLPSASTGDAEPPRGRRRRVAGAAAVGFAGLAGLALWGSGDSESATSLRASILPTLARWTGQDFPEGFLVKQASPDLPEGWTSRVEELEEGTRTVFEHEAQQSLPAGGLSALQVRIPRGELEILPAEDQQVSLRVRREVVTEDLAAAQAAVAGHSFVLEPKDGLAVLSEGENSAETQGIERIRYSLMIPASMAADAVTLAGGIRVGDREGDVTLECSGTICLGKIDGVINARANGGNINMRSGTTQEADLFAIGGDIFLEDASGGARARTSNGDIYLGKSSGEVYAQTSGGDVYVNGVAGQTGAFTSVGDVYAMIGEDPEGLCSFGSTGGGIYLTLANEVKATLVTRSNVDSDLEFTTQTPDDGRQPYEECELNGGGEQVQLSTTSGPVQITRVDHLEDSGLGGSGLGGSGLGGSGLGGSGLGGSGLGGSASGGAGSTSLSAAAVAKTSGSPRPGALATVELPEPVGNLDGYTLYLPVSHAEREGTFPILIYMQGGYGVGGAIADLNNWGLTRLIRDENDMSIERNRLLLDEFIVVSPHIQGGQYYQQPEAIEAILDGLIADHKGDPERIYATGLSRGGHGSWGLGELLPHRLAAIVPVGGDNEDVTDFSKLKDLSIWIAHNRDDRIVPFSEAQNGIDRIEEIGGESFLQLSIPELAESSYLDSKRILTSSPSGGHDAWTDLYMSAEFYRWLLLQKRAPQGEGAQVR